MKRLETISAIALLATIVLTTGCNNSFENPYRRPAPEPSNPKPSATTQAGKITRPIVVIETSMGRITAELWSDSAPITVKNFLAYTDAQHFDGLIFHRVMKGFMIQGGGFDPAMNERATRPEIKNEASADKKNDRGTLAMARTPVIDSATSQFYINLVNNHRLNHRDSTFDGFGYCAFGKVIEGMDVVDKIGSVKVGFIAGHENVPITPVLIRTIRRKK